MQVRQVTTSGERRKRFAALRRRTVVLAAMAVVVPAGALAAASPAMAEPKGIFKIFNECPTEVPGVALCSVDHTTSGEVKLGETKVPIKAPTEIIQQGGLIKTGNPENPREFFAIPAKNGESLSKTELNVPGGLLDLINCEEIKGSGIIESFFRGLCKRTFEEGISQVTATTELVANEKDPVLFNERALSSGKGTALQLPIRIHLKNALLGNSCYIGSETEPIILHLSTGASGTQKGKVGELETLEEKGLVSLRITNNTEVDGTFAVGHAHECGEFFFVKGFLDSLIEGKLKIPNKEGQNAAVLTGELRAAGAEEVIESESF
jgi:hypothetical protein